MTYDDVILSARLELAARTMRRRCSAHVEPWHAFYALGAWSTHHSRGSVTMANADAELHLGGFARRSRRNTMVGGFQAVTLAGVGR